MINSTHHYYLLLPSLWPFLLSLASFNLFLSFFLFLKLSNSLCFFLSMGSSFSLSMFWWLTYGLEFSLEGKNSLTLEDGIKMGMILFISSEIFFFFSFFWSYFHFFLSPCVELGLSYPPVSVEFFDYSSVPFINTLVLVSSGMTVTLSHFFLMKNVKKLGLFWLFLTITLGVMFTFFQFMEYKSAFFSISDGNFGSSFFVLTGFHGIHVLIGSIFLLVGLIRMTNLSSTKFSLLSFELASWYWHFVDVVWIFLYCFLYYLVD